MSDSMMRKFHENRESRRRAICDGLWRTDAEARLRRLEFARAAARVLIDMRPAKKYQQRRLPGARSLPLADLANRFGEVPKSGRVVLYCDCKPYDVADRAVFLEYRGYRNNLSCRRDIKVGSNAATRRRPTGVKGKRIGVLECGSIEF